MQRNMCCGFLIQTRWYSGDNVYSRKGQLQVRSPFSSKFCLQLSIECSYVHACPWKKCETFTYCCIEQAALVIWSCSMKQHSCQFCCVTLLVLKCFLLSVSKSVVWTYIWTGCPHAIEVFLLSAAGWVHIMQTASNCLLSNDITLESRNILGNDFHTFEPSKPSFECKPQI